jgi:hypothetical protein
VAAAIAPLVGHQWVRLSAHQRDALARGLVTQLRPQAAAQAAPAAAQAQRQQQQPPPPQPRRPSAASTKRRAAARPTATSAAAALAASLDRSRMDVGGLFAAHLVYRTLDDAAVERDRRPAGGSSQQQRPPRDYQHGIY